MSPPRVPPSPAEKAYQRVPRLARTNGWSIAIVAGLSTLLALASLDPVGIFLGTAATICGLLEIRGGRKLRRGEIAGVDLAARAELCLLAVIATYCVSRLFSFDAGYLHDQAIPELRQALSLLGTTLEEALQPYGLTVAELETLAHKAFLAFYGTVLLVALLYQGGMVLYYRRQRPRLEEAIARRRPPQNPSTVPPPLA